MSFRGEGSLTTWPPELTLFITDIVLFKQIIVWKTYILYIHVQLDKTNSLDPVVPLG